MGRRSSAYGAERIVTLKDKLLIRYGIHRLGYSGEAFWANVVYGRVVNQYELRSWMSFEFYKHTAWREAHLAEPSERHTLWWHEGDAREGLDLFKHCRTDADVNTDYGGKSFVGRLVHYSEPSHSRGTDLAPDNPQFLFYTGMLLALITKNVAQERQHLVSRTNNEEGYRQHQAKLRDGAKMLERFKAFAEQSRLSFARSSIGPID